MKAVESIFGVAVVLLVLIVSAGTTGAATRARFPAETIQNEPSLRISAGQAHTCMINEGGTVSCWGSNASGQLGDPTLGNFSSPVNVVGITSVVAISAGGAHTCALLADGTARWWGSGGFGQLGNNSTVAIQTAPVAVSGLTGAVAISAGGGHSCALLADGTVRC